MTVGFLAGSGVAFAKDSDAACAKLDKDTLTVDLPCFVSGGKTYSAILKGEIVNGPATPSVVFGGEEQNWLSMSDQKFAEKFAEMAFSYSLVKREIVA
ncbi:MAG: hypothetical protein ABGZ19_04095 [Verrucomicrobiales bacterium]|nr:hypothetical protein [Rhodospirillales bacterium]